MIIPGLPEEISHETFMAASDLLGVPRDGRITEIRLIPGSVEVTFFRESAEPDEAHGGRLLEGNNDKTTLAKVTVPIRVKLPFNNGQAPHS